MNEIDLPEINNEYNIIKEPSKILELIEYKGTIKYDLFSNIWMPPIKELAGNF